jgi:predicted nicotinamide N-methyase
MPRKRGLPSRCDARDFIRANLPLGPVSIAPEILRHKAVSTSGLRRLADQDESFGTPYWAYDWAGGLALARYILDHPQTCAGLRVLDLGAGSGIVGIAAAKAGAAEITAADIDPYAGIAMALNAAANRVRLEIVIADMTEGTPPSVDLVAVGDLFYEPALAARVTRFLERCVAAGAKVLVGDPGRAFLPRAQLRRLAGYPVGDVGDARDAGVASGMVFAFESMP